MDQAELAHVGLGANVGAAWTRLGRAVGRLSALPGVELTGVSRLYRTRPVGPVEQADFLNAVVALRVTVGRDPEQAALTLLAQLKAIERGMGRVERERWGPRELDLDLLLLGPHRLRVERDEAARSRDPARRCRQWLEVPHPAARERLFVLAPLAELAPALAPPGWSETVVQARDRVREVEGREAVQVVGEWDAAAEAWIPV